MRALILLLSSVCLLACARHDALDREEVELPRYAVAEYTDVRFSPPDWPQALYADIYRPEDGSSLKTSARDGTHPMVLVVHGGGWERRSREDMTAIARRLAARGFVAVNVDYRFAPEYQFPAQLHDVQLAMHWMRDHAAQYGGDSHQISALGFSSGAHLVTLLALVAGQGGELDVEYGGVTTRPVSVVAGGTPTDLRKYPAGRLVPQFLGGGRDEIPERFAQASPVTHVHPQAPPFFFFHGGSDRLVPVDHATDMIDALQEVGVDTEFYLMRGRGHVSSFLMSQHAIHAAAGFMISVATAGDIDAGTGFNDEAMERRQTMSSRLP